MERPRARALVVPKLRDLHGRPVWTHQLAPRWPTFDDRDAVAAKGMLQADLVAGILREAVLAEQRDVTHGIVTNGGWHGHAWNLTWSVASRTRSGALRGYLAESGRVEPTA